jgi:hypothetical protein
MVDAALLAARCRKDYLCDFSATCLDLLFKPEDLVQMLLQNILP